MKIEVCADATDVATRGAALIGDALIASAHAKSCATLAVSGGSTPRPLFEALCRREDVPWSDVHLFQVDERIAPDGDPDRNLGMLLDTFMKVTPPPMLHPMPVLAYPVEDEAESYGDLFNAFSPDVAARRPALDVVHLGLGDDGHTASLVAGDAAVDELEALIAVTGDYHGRRRMTMTRRALDGARLIVWQVVGESKAAAVADLVTGVTGPPSTLIARENAIVLLDEAAASRLPATA